MASPIGEHDNRFIQQYRRHGAIYTFILCGIAGALVDIDHILKIFYLLMGGWGNMDGRPLHPVFFLIAFAVCLCFGTLLCSMFLKHYAKKEKEIEIKN